MAVTVEQDGAWSRLKGKTRCARGHEFLEEDAGTGDGFGLAPSLATQQRRCIFADGREAARFAEHNRPSSLGVWVQRVRISRGHLTRARKEALGDLWAAATVVARERGVYARRCQHIERGLANLRLVVIRECVVEEQHVWCARGAPAEPASHAPRERASREPRQATAPIDPDDVLVEDACGRATGNPVRDWCQAAAPDGRRMC